MPSVPFEPSAVPPLPAPPASRANAAGHSGHAPEPFDALLDGANNAPGDTPARPADRRQARPDDSPPLSRRSAPRSTQRSDPVTPRTDRDTPARQADDGAGAKPQSRDAQASHAPDSRPATGDEDAPPADGEIQIVAAGDDGTDAGCANEVAKPAIDADAFMALLADIAVAVPAKDAEPVENSAPEEKAKDESVPATPQSAMPEPPALQPLAAALLATLGEEAAAGKANADTDADTGAVDTDAGAKPDPAALAALAAALKQGQGKPAPNPIAPATDGDAEQGTPVPVAAATGDVAPAEIKAVGTLEGDTIDATPPGRPAQPVQPAQAPQSNEAKNIPTAARDDSDAQDTPNAPPADPQAAARATRIATPADGRHDTAARQQPQFAQPAAEPASLAKSAPEPAPQFALLTSQLTAATTAASPATQPLPAVPVAEIAIEIAARVHAGATRFELRLDPPELGRVDVRLDVDRDGNLSSRLIVERSETLDLLRREAPQLERALQQAGLKLGDNALEFALRDHAFRNDDGADARTNAPQTTISETEPVAIDNAPARYARYFGLGGGVDIRV